MWPYSWTHVGTPSHLGHMDQVAAIMPSQAHAGAVQEGPDIGQWEGQDVPLVRPSSCIVKGGIPSSRRYLPYPDRTNSLMSKKSKVFHQNAHHFTNVMISFVNLINTCYLTSPACGQIIQLYPTLLIVHIADLFVQIWSNKAICP